MLAASFSAAPATLNPASAADDCPAPAAIKDPFSDFDDLKTDEEKREALHEDLDRELAKHKKRCDKKQNAAAQSAQSAASTSGGQSGAQQAEGQQSESENGSNSAQSQNSNSSQGQSQGQSQSDPNSSASQQQQANGQQQQATSQQQAASQQQQAASQQQQSNGQQQQSASQQQQASGQQQQQSGSAAAQAQQAGTYSSPWATRQSSAAGSGQVMLEPMAEPTQKEPDPAQQAGQSGTSQEATGPAGTGGQTEEQGSVFLKTYGGQQGLAGEKIEDIAGRHKTNQQYGSPGSAGAFRHQPFSSSPGKKPGEASTVSAEDTVLAALKKRLAEETDPAKKKEIQAQIDSYRKK